VAHQQRNEERREGEHGHHDHHGQWRGRSRDAGLGRPNRNPGRNDRRFTRPRLGCLDANQVRAIRDELAGEGWSLPDSRDEPEEYDDFVDLLPFFDAAARGQGDRRRHQLTQ
jgi:hypothetical protein